MGILEAFPKSFESLAFGIGTCIVCNHEVRIHIVSGSSVIRAVTASFRSIELEYLRRVRRSIVLLVQCGMTNFDPVTNLAFFLEVYVLHMDSVVAIFSIFL